MLGLECGVKAKPRRRVLRANIASPRSFLHESHRHALILPFFPSLIP
jgi:hypothetical protein